MSPELRFALERSQRLAMLGRDVATLAHELAGPLGVVRLSLDLLSSGLVEEGPRREETLADASEALGQVEGILDDVRGLADFATRSVETRLDEVARSALRLTRWRLPRTVEVVEDLEPVVLERGHRHRLVQVCANLLLNAGNALARRGGRGRIVLSTRDEGGAARLVVEDDGPGIAPAERDRIFDPFVSVGENDHRLGLGLWLSRAIVEEHEGTLSLAASSGSGTRFVVEFPAPTGGT